MGGGGSTPNWSMAMAWSSTARRCARSCGSRGCTACQEPGRPSGAGPTSRPPLTWSSAASTGQPPISYGSPTLNTEHPTREGKLYCCVVLDVFSRRVVGWSIDTHQATPLVTNALGMAITNRTPIPDQTVIHSDHGSQYTSWAFTQRAKESRLLPSMGTIGDAYDNAVIESFWARMQTELLDRRRWRTRLELANAIFEYLEIFHNRQRRHSALGWRTPIEYEQRHTTNVA